MRRNLASLDKTCSLLCDGLAFVQRGDCERKGKSPSSFLETMLGLGNAVAGSWVCRRGLMTEEGVNNGLDQQATSRHWFAVYKLKQNSEQISCVSGSVESLSRFCSFLVCNVGLL